MTRNHEAERFGDSAQLGRGEPFAYHLERKVDGGIDDEEVLDLAAGPGGRALEPFRVRVVKSHDTGEGGPGEEHRHGVEIAGVAGKPAALEQRSHCEEQGRAGEQVEV